MYMMHVYLLYLHVPYGAKCQTTVKLVKNILTIPVTGTMLIELYGVLQGPIVAILR